MRYFSETQKREGKEEKFWILRQSGEQGDESFCDQSNWRESRKSGIFLMESEVKKRQGYDEDLTICKRSLKKPSLSHALSSVVAPIRTMIN